MVRVAIVAGFAAVVGGCNGDRQLPWTFEGRADGGTSRDGRVRADGSDFRDSDIGTDAGGMPEATAVALSAGWRHTCAVLQRGEVRCWGDGRTGQLGDGTTSESAPPVSVDGIESATDVAAGQSHTCAVLEDGSVRCWGEGRLGQLGDGEEGGTYKRTTSVEVQGISTAIDLAAGARHSCAVLESGRVRCWGQGREGQLGNGREGRSYRSATPVEVEGLRTATDIAAGAEFSCAVLEGGGVRCWGANQATQLGKPRPVDPDEGDLSRPVPVEIEEISSAREIAAGRRYACVTLQDGNVRCWGLVPSEPGSTNPTPVEVAKIDTAVGVSAGDGHVCAVVERGEVRCWGEGNWGQLGDGNPSDPGAERIGRYESLTPTAVEGITSATEVAAGEAHSCALLQDGGVRCWGRGDRGQIGPGASGADASTTPVTVRF